MNILPHDEAGSHRTGSIDSGYTVAEINRILGFKPNIQDDPQRVKHSWGFTADGQPCGIWDYGEADGASSARRKSSTGSSPASSTPTQGNKPK